MRHSGSWWQLWRHVCRLSLLVLVVAGCGGSSTSDPPPARHETSRLLLQMTLSGFRQDSPRGSSARAEEAAPTRQTGRAVAQVLIDVRGPDLAGPLQVACAVAAPSAPPCRLTETPTALLLEVDLLVPVGRERSITVTVLDAAGALLLQRETLVDLLQPVALVTLTLQATNTAPVAQAGADQTVPVGTTVTLHGEGSSDAEGQALTFAWEVLLRPPGSQAVLTHPTSVQPTLVVDRAGNYMAQLTVHDGTEASLPDTVEITTRNSAPQADAGPAQGIQVGGLVTLQGARSSDVDGDALTFRWTLRTRPPGSQAVLAQPTTVQPTFVPDRPGTYVAELVVSDGQASSEPATVTLTTENVPPVAQAGPNQTAVLGATVQLDGSGSSDADGDALTFAWALTTRPLGSTATLSNPTSVTPTLVIDQLGGYVAQLIVNDSTVDSAPTTVTITTGNAAPIADAGLPQTAPVGTVVRLDGRGSRDPDNDPLTFTWALLVLPPGSSTTLANPTSAQPSFRVDLPGTYVAQLRVNDGLQDSTPATVTIDTVNSRPVAQAGATQQGSVGATVVLDGRASSDADQDPLTFRWALTVRPPGSTATLPQPTMAQPRFIPDLPGLFVAQVIVNDGALDSAPATVSITVIQLLNLPVANAGPDQVVGPRVLVTLDGRGSSDPDGDVLTFRWTQIAGPGVALANATTARPSFTTPDAAVDTVLRFQLVVNDGTTDSAPATVAITVLAGVNRAPLALPLARNTIEDTAVVLTLTATDPEVGTTLSFSIIGGPRQGTLGPLGPVVCLPEASGVVCHTAVTYTPTPNANGPDSFTFQASDGVLSSAVVTASLTRQPVNDAPVAVDDTFVTTEDTPLTLGAPGLLANDQDVDGDPLAALLLTGPTHGQVVLRADGSLRYTPQPNYTGPDHFTYQATDGALTSNPATVSLTVTGVNDGPLAQNDVYTTPQETPLSVPNPGVLANDNDFEDSRTALTAVLLTPPAQGLLALATDGAFTYTPPNAFVGTTSFTYQAQDTAGVRSNTATVMITVTPLVNNAPEALNDQYTTDEDTVLTIAAPGVLGNDTDVEGQTLTALLVAPPLWGTLQLAPDGSVVYTPHLDRNGADRFADSFMYKANDGTSDSNVAMVILNITPVNDAPVANAGPAQHVATGTLVTLDGRGSSDVEGTPLTFAWTLTSVPPGSRATLANPATATPTLTPDMIGDYTAQLVVNDGSLNSSPATVVITAVPPSVRLALVGTAGVGVGRTATIQATLTAPAPAGGVAVTVTVTSDAPATLTVTPPGTITIAPGGTTGQISVNGIAPGSALLRGQAPGYTAGTLTVSVSLNRLSLPATLNIPFGETVSVPVTIAPDPAPAGGVVVALVSSDPTRVHVLTPTVTIPAGSVSANGTVQGAGIGPAMLTASNVNFASATAAVTVSAPALTVTPAAATVGAGLRLAPSTIVLKTPAPPGGLLLQVSSSDATKVLLAPNGTTAGTATLTLPIAAGHAAGNFSVQGLESATPLPSTVTLTVSAPGYTNGTSTVTVVRPAFQLIDLPTSLTALAPEAPFRVTVGVPAGAGVTPQDIRSGGPSLTATVSTSAPLVAQLTTSAGPAQHRTVQIPPNDFGSPHTVATGGVALDPLRPGTTTVTATIPGLLATPQATMAVTVSVPAITVTPAAATVGAGLQLFCCAVSLETPAPPGGLLLQVSSSDATKVLLAPNGTTAGTATISLPIAAGVATASFVAQGLENATPLPSTVTLTVSAPGYTNGTNTVTVVRPAFRLTGLPTSLTTLAPEAPFQVTVGIPAGAGVTPQEVRMGGPSLTATVSTSAPLVAQLTTSAGPAQHRTVQIPPGRFVSPDTVAAGGVALDPLNTGTTTVTATIPGFLDTPAATVAVTGTTTTTTPRLLTVSPVAETVGAGLQTFLRIILEPPAPPDGLQLQVSSSDATKVLLAAPDIGVVAGTLTRHIPAGVSSASFMVQGREGATPLPSTVTLTVSSPGYTTGTGTVTVVQPAFQLFNLPTRLLRFAPDAPFQVVVGVPFGTGVRLQPVRFGGSPLTATVSNSAAGVAQLTTSAGSAQRRTVQIPPSQFFSSDVALDPLSAGTTTVTATIPGFLATPQATVRVTIPTTPALGMFLAAGTVVGAGLQAFCLQEFCSMVNLETPAPAGGLVLQVRSSDTTKILLAPDGITAGTPTLTLPVAAGHSFSHFAIHGLESATPLPSPVTLTVSAPGYTDATTTVMVVQPALQLFGVPPTITALSADDPFQVFVGVPFRDSGAVLRQPVRIGGQPLTATVSSSAARVAQLTTSAGAAQSRTVQILPGQDRSSEGRIALRPLTAGTTTVAASIPGSLATAAVTVLAPTLTVTPAAATVSVGAKTFNCCAVHLGEPAPAGGVMVQITSSDPGSVLLAPDQTTAGVPVLTLPVAAGNRSTSFVVQGLETAPTLPATVVLTATAAGYSDGSNTVTVTAPMIRVFPSVTTRSATTVGAGLQAFRCCTVSLGAFAPPGGVMVQITSSDPSSVLLAPNETTAGVSVLTLPVAAGDSETSFVVQGLETAPTLPATVVLTATAAGHSDGSNSNTVTVRVVQPVVGLSFLPETIGVTARDQPFSVRVGIVLEGFVPQLQKVRSGGPALTATVTNSSPAVAQLVTREGPTQTASVTIPPGQSRSLNALEKGGVVFDPLTVGTTTLRVTIPTFVLGNEATVNISVTP